MSFRLEYADGGVVIGFASPQAALDWLERHYPDYSAGHDGDLSDGGDRTLVWACEADSIDDDGARAVATIRREVSK